MSSVETPSAYRNPTMLPKHIFMTPSAMPPKPGVHTESARPARSSEVTLANTLIREAVTGSPVSSYSGASSTTLCPAALNSGETTSPALPVVTAKETSVGGTSICSNVPLMESLPPMAAMPRAFCASNAPSSAASGCPQRAGSCPGFRKYSWKERYVSAVDAPEATSFATLSTTARYAP